MDSEQQRDLLSTIIRKIYKVPDRDWTEAKIKSFAEEFEQYYMEGYYNLYSGTYKWIADFSEDGTAEYLDRRLCQIEDYFSEHYPNHKEKFIKLRDYVILECSRSLDRSSLQIEVEQTTSDAKRTLDRISSLTKEFEETRKDASTQTITVLSIFTGIAMAFFGGFSLLGSAFDNIAYGLPSAAILAILVGIVLFNTVFSFIYLAGRISGKTVSDCSHTSCGKCEEVDCQKKNWIKRFWKKYPYILAVNVFLFLLLCLFILFYFVLPDHGFPVVPSNSATSESAVLPCTSTK